MEFAFAGDCLRIANGLDENRIELGEAQPDYVRHRLGELEGATGLLVSG